MRFGFSRENISAHQKKTRFMENVINEYAKNNKKPYILDIGCGRGRRIALALAEKGYRILGIDLDRSIIKKAQKTNPYPWAEFKNVSLEDFQCNQKFDIIICSDVLEHVESSLRALKKIKKLLKKRGVILISIPNKYGLFEIQKYLFVRNSIAKRYSKWAKINDNPGHQHIQFFTFGKFKKLLENQGLKIKKIGKSGLLGDGPLTKKLAKNRAIVNWNAKIGDKLPLFMVTSWYLEVVKEQND